MIGGDLPNYYVKPFNSNAFYWKRQFSETALDRQVDSDCGINGYFKIMLHRKPTFLVNISNEAQRKRWIDYNMI